MYVCLRSNIYYYYDSNDCGARTIAGTYFVYRPVTAVTAGGLYGPSAFSRLEKLKKPNFDRPFGFICRKSLYCKQTLINVIRVETYAREYSV